MRCWFALWVALMAATPTEASECLLYSTVEGRARTIFAYDPATAQTTRVFSDARSEMKLMTRGGARDSVNVIRAGSRAIVAVGKENGASSPAGSLYEICLDGSNQARKIAAIESAVPVGRIALDPAAQRVAYPRLQRDKGFSGEGQSNLVSAIIIHDLGTGEILRRAVLFEQPPRTLISYLAWSPSGDTLYLHLEGGEQRAGLYALKDGVLQRLPLQLDPLKKVVGQTASGDFLMTYLGSPKFAFESLKGERVREGQFTQDRHGWHYELSRNDRLLAFQTIAQEIWVKDLESGKELQVPLHRGGAPLTLIGWTDDAAESTNPCAPRCAPAAPPSRPDAGPHSRRESRGLGGLGCR